MLTAQQRALMAIATVDDDLGELLIGRGRNTPKAALTRLFSCLRTHAVAYMAAFARMFSIGSTAFHLHKNHGVFFDLPADVFAVVFGI